MAITKERIAVVMGTRPEGMKLCPLILAMRRHALSPCVITSGQHVALLEEVMEAFFVKADVALLPPPHGEDIAALLSSLLSDFETAFRALMPPLVVVQGDTATAFAAALCAFLLRIPVVHIEAGLRSGDPFSPFPEEGFRRSIAALACLHIAPTPQAMYHLWAEGVPKSRVYCLGNTVEDAVRLLSPPRKEAGRQILFTLHRRECSQEQMEGIFLAVKEIAARFPSHTVLYPVHPSPRVRRVAEAVLGGADGIRLSPPLPPKAFYRALAEAPFVMTDSGGVQEEAALLGVPTLVLRENTERERELQSGRIFLAGTDRERIVSLASAWIKKPPKMKKESRHGSPSDKICKVLLSFIKDGSDMPRLFRES